ncbi:hypothetical protein BH11PSE2_BH11PSE2_21030 [soil metagenome]
MSEANASYDVRPGVLAAPTQWSLDAGELVRRVGERERRWPLARLRRAAVSVGTRGQRSLSLSFPRTVVRIGSHSFAGFGRVEDHTPAFSAFARAVCLAGVAASPKARFESTALSLDELFDFTGAIMAFGLVTILASSLAMGVAALGFEFAARLAFVLCLMTALKPWLGANRRRFDPLSPPFALLP